MRSLSFSFVLFCFFSLSSPAFANNYGAIAYDLGTNAYGATWDQPSQDAADQVALSRCRSISANCAVVSRFVNNCGAYATGMNGVTGSGYGATREQAMQAATFFCRLRGPGCKARVWGCNTRAASAEPFSPFDFSPKGDPDRNRWSAEEARRWGGQEQYDRICRESPGGCGN